jgi:uncharacterized protein (DUF4415 family)
MAITTIGLDLAKTVFQVRRVDASGAAVFAAMLGRPNAEKVKRAVSLRLDEDVIDRFK